jgi:hypothetical protein
MTSGPLAASASHSYAKGIHPQEFLAATFGCFAASCRCCPGHADRGSCRRFLIEESSGHGGSSCDIGDREDGGLLHAHADDGVPDSLERYGRLSWRGCVTCCSTGLAIRTVHGRGSEESSLSAWGRYLRVRLLGRTGIQMRWK